MFLAYIRLRHLKSSFLINFIYTRKIALSVMYLRTMHIDVGWGPRSAPEAACWTALTVKI